MKTTYLVLILAVVVVLGLAIHYYSDRLAADSASASSAVGMVFAPAVRAG
ncbi:MAG TPA: hypothetical protein VMV15_00100 [Candidatus Binataceae bacterium]|nr:hypothetical protein [Candidatus Binataceae bacterium]